MATVEQAAQHFRGIDDHRESGAHPDRMGREVSGCAGDQRRGQAHQAQAIDDSNVRIRRNVQTHIEDRRAVQQPCRLVAAASRAHQKLARHVPVAGMQRDRVLGAQAPVIPEPLRQVSRAKGPERRVPVGALTLRTIGPRGDVPPFHHLTNEPAPEQPLPVDTREIGRPDRRGIHILQPFQGGQRLGELVCGRCHLLGNHVLYFLGFRVLFNLGFYVKPFLGYYAHPTRSGWL
ncbi:MAG: hypothetical protein QM766_26435 [Burkholderiaceae bacterium]